MGSLSGLGIGLSFVFGCILMGVVAEIYYLLWWKKRVANSKNNREETKEFSFLFCWKKPTCFNSSRSSKELSNSVRNPQEEEQQDLEMGSSKDLGLKGYGEEGVETELMRLHNLCGPPRFLFTIKEESKEDLESDDGKSRGDRSSRKGSRTRSLSDLVFALDGTTTTPLSSPTVKTPHTLDSCNNLGFNPLFESLSEAELNRLRSSPPPKFKFLKDAEDKLLRRVIMEESERKKGLKNTEIPGQDSQIQEEKAASFVSLISKNFVVRDHQLHKQASQVLPLASSPTFNPVLDKKSSVQ